MEIMKKYFFKFHLHSLSCERRIISVLFYTQIPQIKNKKSSSCRSPIQIFGDQTIKLRIKEIFSYFFFLDLIYVETNF